MYQPYPYQQFFGQQPVQVPRVTGEPGARAYQLPPDSSILLPDETAPIVWLKTTDGGGFATLVPYKIEPYQPEPPADSLEARIKRLEELYESDIAKAAAAGAEQPDC